MKSSRYQDGIDGLNQAANKLKQLKKNISINPNASSFKHILFTALNRKQAQFLQFIKNSQRQRSEANFQCNKDIEALGLQIQKSKQKWEGLKHPSSYDLMEHFLSLEVPKKVLDDYKTKFCNHAEKTVQLFLILNKEKLKQQLPTFLRSNKMLTHYEQENKVPHPRDQQPPKIKQQTKK